MVDDPRDVVVKLNFDVEVDTAVPLPFILASEREVNIVFYGMKRISEDRSEECVAIAYFKFGEILRFGGPNDEALPGHPLYGKGLQFYAIHEIRNSTEVARLENENRVKFPNTKTSGDSHYLITFHDSMYEGTGELTVTVSELSYDDTVRAVMERMLRNQG